MEHFGLKLVKRKYSFKLNREEFAPISTKPSIRFFLHWRRWARTPIRLEGNTGKSGARNIENCALLTTI